MPSFLDAMFSQLDEQIQLTEEDRARFELRANEVMKILAGANFITECSIIGSFTRKTALRELSDVDLLAVTTTRSSDSTPPPASVLSKIADTVEARGRQVERGNIAVTVRYPKNPSVDILPALSIKPAGHYLIPEYGNHWQEFEPSKLDHIVNTLTVQLGPEVRTIIRLLKYWNQNKNVGLISSDIEEIVCIILLRHRAIPEYMAAVSEVFDFILDWAIDSSESIEAIGRRCRSESIDRTLAITAEGRALTLKSEDASETQSSFREIFGV
ncbi:hypothetical protein [Lentzea sp. NPDC059081]|uniref:SMODS domain-containing nucleotidyltransferase n=1 Tax=Lentzea sp. NPDC059081 TaxID=3346719 RepID=UPI0036C683E4